MSYEGISKFAAVCFDGYNAEEELLLLVHPTYKAQEVTTPHMQAYPYISLDEVT